MGYPALWIAWRELLAHPARSLAAGVGVFLAVAALVAGTSLRAGAERRETREAAALGQGLIVLTPGVSRQGVSRASLLPASFDDADVAALRREVVGIDKLAIATSRRAIVANEGKTQRALVMGTTPELFALTARPLSAGRWMTAAELASGAPVCIIGQLLRTRLFDAADPLGRTVRTGTLLCQVIGVLATPQAVAAPDPGAVLVLPIVTLQRDILGTQNISAIYISSKADHSRIVVKHQVEMLMRERRHLNPNAVPDFSISEGSDLIPAEVARASTLPSTLEAVAALSFLLGGVCILTSLFWSIRDRKRQLGVSLAMGASGRDMALHLCIESVLLSTLAGLSGVPLGLALAFAEHRRAGLDMGVSASGLALALLGSVAVGVLFALPAARAATTHPPTDKISQQ
jgi:putative ABC transport system permease protein